MLRKMQRIVSAQTRELRFRGRISTEFCGGFNELKTIFIHIPKCGGTSVALSLFGHQVGHSSVTDYYRKDYTRAAQYFKFSFVRHPVDRLYSAFTYLQRGGMNADDRRFAEQNLKGLSFEAFVQRLANCPKLLEWVHFKPQFTFLYDGVDPKNLLINYVGRFEDFEQATRHISERLDIEVTVPHRNVTQRLNRQSESVTEASRQLVKQVYALDFEVFGYDS